MAIEPLLAYFENWTGRPSISRHCLGFDDHGAVGYFGDFQLRSAFQPLHDAAGKRVPSAFEALLRVTGPSGANVPPHVAFGLPQTTSEIVYFDRLCRMVHVVNFVTQSTRSSSRLFLNVDGRHLASIRSGEHGGAFETLLHHAGLSPRRVVLEVLESSVDDFGLLQDAVKAYQLRGFGVAIDDFGAQHSNFDRLWRLEPDIVKLDRNMSLEAARNPRARRILPKLVDILHDLGACVISEGIETHEHWQIAENAGVDMIQGFLFSRPQSELQEFLAGPATSKHSEPISPARQADILTT
ncbi:EAL domain-containing protein [Uliginosibacterium gangwonense]|uniref:EAL domain-containing protein n=1 Tax=Uliginosibacterium gangwonense TaxID=392736 RepID=UPI001B7F99D6|nr:EAL domain-containing protein [Uliginosibacterium gangwonense]